MPHGDADQFAVDGRFRAVRVGGVEEQLEAADAAL